MKFWRKCISMMLGVGLLVGIGVVGVAAPAYAGPPVLDSFLSLGTTVVNADKSITVKIKLKRDLPERAGITLSWKYPSQWRDNGRNSSKTISGKAGATVTYNLATPGYVQVVNVTIELIAGSTQETLSRPLLVAPKTTVTYSTVSAANAAANAVAIHIPGIILTFVPKGKALKAVGKALLGWSVFRDLKASLSGVTTACPKLRVGQYVKTTSWVTANSTSASYRVRNQVWESKAAFTAAKTPACNVSYVALKIQ